MSDLEQRLREELPGLVPQPPVVADRAAGARALAGRARRRTALAVAGASAVVIAVAALGGSLLRDSAPAPTDPAAGFTCRSGFADAAGSGDLAEDPVAVRLCSWGPGTATIQSPVDALMEGAAPLARLVNALPEHEFGTASDSPRVCHADGGTSFALVFRYADGSERAVTGEDYGCRLLQVRGGPGHGDPGAALGAFVRALHEQRTRTAPPDLPGLDPTCGSGAWEPIAAGDQMMVSLARIDEVDRARVCIQRERPNGTPTGPLRQTDLSTGEIEAVREAWSSVERGGQLSMTGCPTDGHAWLVGVTPWGETLRAELCSSLMASADSLALVEQLDARAVPQ